MKYVVIGINKEDDGCCRSWEVRKVFAVCDTAKQAESLAREMKTTPKNDRHVWGVELYSETEIVIETASSRDEIIKLQKKNSNALAKFRRDVENELRREKERKDNHLRLLPKTGKAGSRKRNLPRKVRSSQ